LVDEEYATLIKRIGLYEKKVRYDFWDYGFE
jgi:hypothetical protein